MYLSIEFHSNNIYKEYSYYSAVRIWGHTTLIVLEPFSCSGNKTLIRDSEVQCERATYNYPWEKTEVCRSKPTFATDWPWDLLMVIANASRTGNWWQLNLTGISSADGSSDILGIKTVFPHPTPERILHSKTCGLILVRIRWVPLQRPLDASKFQSSIKGLPT